jgi:hypothetical protein
VENNRFEPLPGSGLNLGVMVLLVQEGAFHILSLTVTSFSPLHIQRAHHPYRMNVPPHPSHACLDIHEILLLLHS